MCPGYDIKLSDGEASVLDFREYEYSFMTINFGSTLTWSGNNN